MNRPPLLLIGLLLTLPLSFASTSTRKPANTVVFAVVGDTQRTLPEEKVLGREQNDLERDEIVDAIVAEHPAFLVHLGDMVDWGESTYVWNRFDRLIKPVRDAKIPIFPVLGNHDYFGRHKNVSLANAYARFPQLKDSHWYTKTTEGLALIFLDSNMEKLSAPLWNQQLAWLKKTLSDFNADPAIRGIIFFNHHPAFTNSKITGDEPAINQFILPIFRSSKKTIAYITGHAHGYEHFEDGGKQFIISAGGGGPRVEYLTGTEARHKDLFNGPAPRPFNYLLIQANDNEVVVRVKGFNKGQHLSDLRVIDTITIPY